MPYRPETRAIQEAVAALGHDPGPIDGLFGKKTRAGVSSWLDAGGEPAARPAPPDDTLFHGAAKRLDDIDLPLIGQTIGVGEDELHAVIEVETAGGGFDGEGRVRMLFEPHVFYRELGPGAARDRAVRDGLAYASWGQEPYPSDSYPRLQAAREIDDDAALRSASWGLAQIMGFNASLAGHASAAAMIAAFAEDEEAHLAAMVKFIVSAGLDDELRRHDWSGFARGYNGSSYAQHGYHTRLAEAYAKWARIPDTPLPGAG